MTHLFRKIFRYLYYLAYGRSGRAIRINNEEYTVSAHIARGVNSVIDEVPLKLLNNLCRNAAVLFDIGGNIGVIAALLAKKMQPGSLIYSFEPAPLSFKYLEDTARVQKGNARIIPVNAAVSNNNTLLNFVNNGSSCRNMVSVTDNEQTIRIEPITIDSFCKSNNVIPQVIKVDIEGAEYWALEGMHETLKKNNCIVLVEIHTVQLETNHIDNAMFRNLIDSIGYRVFDVDGNEIGSDKVMDTACVILSKTQPPKSVFMIS